MLSKGLLKSNKEAALVKHQSISTAKESGPQMRRQRPNPGSATCPVTFFFQLQLTFTVILHSFQLYGTVATFI